MKKNRWIFVGSLMAVLLLALAAGLTWAQGPAPQGDAGVQAALGTAFTYQGQLKKDGNPINDTCDFQFSLWDAESGGNPIGTTQMKTGVSVNNGFFTIPDLDFGAGAFQGDARWLQIAVKCTGDSDYTTLSPRQPLTAAPYALYSLKAPWSGLTGVPAGFADGVDNDTNYSAGTGLSLSGTEFSVNFDGSGTANTVARSDHNHDGTYAPVAHTHDDRYWKLTGNAGTDPTSNFLGTTDNKALEFRVNNQRALRLEPNATSPNLIGGYSGNSVTAGVVGATIGGGGSADMTCGVGGDPCTNRVTDDFGTVGGGYGNRAGDDAGTISRFPTVGGGSNNTASGYAATVGGGSDNTASDDSATVGGGTQNDASGQYATVGGGGWNTASGNYATVSGGGSNTASGQYATVGGGTLNDASDYSATVGGGWSNTASDDYATVGGGSDNTASDYSATVGGGWFNTASGWAATVPGGVSNTASGDYSFAAGRRAKANHNGTFVWADSTDADFASTGANQFLIRASGGVGIGTNSPQAQLHVQEAINGAASLPNHVAIIENTAGSTTNGPDVLALKTSATGNLGGNTNFITFFDGNNNSKGAIEGNGSGGVVLAGPGSDYAEWLPLRDASETVQPGDIVAWTPEGITHRTTDALRLMVVSSSPIVAGNAPMTEDRSGWAPVAFVGQVPVRVRGPVQAGDFILPSGQHDGTGVAVPAAKLRAEQVGQVVGRALESAEGQGLHTVKVLVGLPPTDLLQALLAERDAQLAQQQAQIGALEARLAALEQRGGVASAPAGALPVSGLALGGVALVGAVAYGRRKGGGR